MGVRDITNRRRRRLMSSIRRFLTPSREPGIEEQIQAAADRYEADVRAAGARYDAAMSRTLGSCERAAGSLRGESPQDAEPGNTHGNLILEDLMDEYEMVRRVRVLPEQFASRLDESVNEGLRSMNDGGEWDELIDLLVAALVNRRAAVTAAEQQELRELLAAMHMPTDMLERIKVAESADD